MSEEAPFFGETIVDDSGKLRSCGLVDLIHKFAPKTDAEGRLYTTREPKTVEVRAKLRVDERNKRKIIGGILTCRYDDGTARSFEVGMPNTRFGNFLVGNEPRTIEIITGHLTVLTIQQDRSLGLLLRNSRGAQLNLRETMKAHMASHPLVGTVERCVAKGAVTATAATALGQHILPSIGSGIVVGLIEPIAEWHSRRRQKNEMEIHRKAAARGRWL
jgi:hypothetical protein